MIKDGWNVPSRIPYASTLEVEDGAPVTREITAGVKGKIKFFKTKIKKIIFSKVLADSGYQGIEKICPNA